MFKTCHASVMAQSTYTLYSFVEQSCSMKHPRISTSTKNSDSDEADNSVLTDSETQS